MLAETIPAEKAKPNAFERFNHVLKLMIEKEASDLHVSVGSGFRIRVLGDLIPSPDTAPLTPSEIADANGLPIKLVREIVNKVDRNEYKRQQAAPGLKVTTKAFGIGRRFPG